MSELETLYIRVKLETDEIKKGVEQALSQIQKLENEFENLSKSTDKVQESFANVLSSTKKMLAGYAGFHTILSGATGAISAIRDLGNASRELNVDVTALDAWGHAVQRTGGTVQQFQASLAGLATHFGTTNEIALRALPRLADAFAKLNPRQAQQYGKSLGLDLSTILLLQQGRREVEAVVAQQQKLGLVTKEQVENTRKFDNALYDASRAYQSFYRELALPLLPGITTALEYVIQHKDVAEDAFKGMAVAVAALGVALIEISPIFRLAAAITAIGVAYGLVKEDIKFFKEGGDSLIGKTLGVTPGSVKSSEQVVKNFGGYSVGNTLLDIPSQVFNQVKHSFGFGGDSDSKKTEVNIENVNVNTAATDADGIAAAAKGSLQRELSQLTSHTDNGVHA